MCASSWATTMAMRTSSFCEAVAGSDEQRGLPERHAAEVLHRPVGEVGDRDEVHLVAGVGDAEVLLEEAQRERADVEGERREVPLAGRVDDAERHAVDVDGRRRTRTGRRRRRRGTSTSSSWSRSATSRRPSSSGVSAVTRELEYAASPAGATSVTVNVALNDGSSKQGNARRASVASNCVVAIVWVVAVRAGERRAVEAAELVVEPAGELDRQHVARRARARPGRSASRAPAPRRARPRPSWRCRRRCAGRARGARARRR